MSQFSKNILHSSKRALLDAMLKDAGMEATTPQRIPRRVHTGPIPASFAQQRLWLIDQLTPHQANYNIPLALHLRGPLQVPALQASVTTIVERHEVLRTVFVPVDGMPTQRILPPAPVPLPLVDVPALDEQTQAALLQTQLLQEAAQPFDLAQGPLLRAKLFRLGAEDHVVMLTMHHIVGDGWSGGVLIQELQAAYRAHVLGTPVALPELDIQYADFAVWQREYLQGEVLERQLSYWQTRLEHPPILELPTDRPRPPVQTTHGAREHLDLGQALSHQLTTLARDEGCTLFMLMLAAFGVVLARYSGQADMVIGTPIANRNRPEIANLIGFFVNTLPLRVDLSGNPSFRHLLQRVRTLTLEAYDHQDVPFEKIVEVLLAERDLSRSPLFQVMLAVQNKAASTLDLPGLAASEFVVENGTAKFDLGMEVTEHPAGLHALVEYNTDLFDATTIQRLLGNFQTLLGGIVAHPDCPILTLPLLTDSERALLLEQWQTPAGPIPDVCIHEAFEAQAARTPDAPAVIFPALSSNTAHDQVLTYRQLNERANQLARHLRSLGAGPETIVAIYTERSLHMVVAVLGILKAGAAYLPLNFNNPPDRLAFVIADTQPVAILTQQDMRAGLPAYDGPIIALDADWPEVAVWPDDNLSCGTTLENLVAIIYTSGSTGTPKGAAMTGRGYLNMFCWYREHMGLNTETRFLLQLALSFDSAFKNIMVPLLVGGQVVLGPARYTDPAVLVQIIETHQVTSFSTTPTQLYPMIDLSAARAYAPLASLRCIDMGGETAQLAKLHPWLRSPQCHTRLMHVYGPTECSDLSSAYGLMTAEEVLLLDKLPIGYPLTNMRIYVVNQHHELQPIGVPGEICISGVGLARSYFNRPALTAERFVVNPFVPGARMYRSGDVGRWRADGTVELLGRVDHQVKIRGMRVELGEIEAQLGQYPGVQSCVVVAREDEPGDKRLVAYVVARPDQVVQPQDMRQFLLQHLPEYMVPSAWMLLEQMPLLTNGKIDRRALPQPTSTNIQGDAFVAPRTPLEEILATIWGEVLKLDQVSIDSNFFASGGHSLLATQVVAQIRDILQVDIPLQTIFEAPTVAKLAEALLHDPERRAHIEQVVELLINVAQLSEEEVDKMLSDKQ
jgi:amino acid adenylation domain-containing protein